MELALIEKAIRRDVCDQKRGFERRKILQKKIYRILRALRVKKTGRRKLAL